jgi:stage V sporulation protein D (sporulation-specific penicillin-binding protein)
VEQRQRKIKAARGRIIDRNGVVLASNQTVCTISVIHSQIRDAEQVVDVLVQELGMERETVEKRVNRVSSIETIRTNVSKEVGERIRSYELAGVKVDDDYKRYYPYDTLLSKVLGFTGGDDQGIIGLESYYDSYLQGISGQILTFTDVRGIEIDALGEVRKEPENGSDLYVSLDYNISAYALQLAETAMEEHQASAVEILVMNPKNGEIYTMVNAPEFSLNDPFSLESYVGEETSADDLSAEETTALLNEMWRNAAISDTYEPGSTFKIITTAAALENQVVTLEENFYCTGSILVEDTRIRCHKTAGHGSQDFVHSIMNSCNPVFIQLGQRLGVENFFAVFSQFQLLEKTGIDLPGEAGAIMHQQENVGPVELATISFGQSFQVTPIQMAATVSSLINGGKRITPHVAVEVKNEQGETTETFVYEEGQQILSEETSEQLRYLLEMVVAEGSGKNAQVAGFSIGGKTATSQMLPRGSGKYIASFIGFAPAEDPEVLAVVIIHEPVGSYYGGTIAAPVAAKLFANILPYLEEGEK